jgi:uncharacterized protein YeaO (DUF488 family)
MEIRVKRVYEPPSTADGQRILVDRLWPRGLSKAEAYIDLWWREGAPSNELRTWFGHNATKWEGFRRRYHLELKGNPQALVILKQYLARGTVTLLFAARDTEHNHAVALREYLQRMR